MLGASLLTAARSNGATVASISKSWRPVMHAAAASTPSRGVSSSAAPSAAAAAAAAAAVAPSTVAASVSSSSSSSSSRAPQPPPRRNLSLASTPHAESLRTLEGVEEAVEVIDKLPAIKTELVITCEHASVRLPEPWEWPSGDSRLVATHWSFDAGAEEFTRELSKRLPSVAVLARFSRLLCDANRPIGSETMFRKEAEGKPILLNQNLTESEIQRRLDTLYHPFHHSLKRVCDVVKPRLVLAIHSFSPEYEGQKRDIEIGVLVKHEKDRALADKFVEAYAKIGLRVAINEPWSALDGYAFTANSFNSVRCASIMLEFRQDLAVQAAWALKVTQATIDVLREAGHQ